MGEMREGPATSRGNRQKTGRTKQEGQNRKDRTGRTNKKDKTGRTNKKDKQKGQTKSPNQKGRGLYDEGRINL
jgi:hypothetical protein